MPSAPAPEPEPAVAAAATRAPVAPASPYPGRARLLRHLAFMCLLCTAIALLVTAIDGRGFRYKLVYSFSIGFICWLLTDGMRMLLVSIVRRRRAASGHPSPDSYHLGRLGMLPLFLIAVLAGPPLGLSIGDAITGFQSPSLLQWSSAGARVTLALSLIGSLAAWLVMTLLEQLADSRAAAEAARRQAAENQLKLLQSQLEPHMLFNTLANLRVLIGLDAAQAQAMLDRLIAFLRATLNASRSTVHPLASEFERVQDYLALMSVRMGPRLQTELVLPPELANAAMPALLLQPLVENSIRHGLEPKVQGGRIALRAWREGEELHISVRDTGVGLAAGTPASLAGTGFGLEQARARLATLHGDRARLTLQAASDAEGGTLAHVTLPYQAMP